MFAWPAQWLCWQKRVSWNEPKLDHAAVSPLNLQRRHQWVDQLYPRLFSLLVCWSKSQLVSRLVLHASRDADSRQCDGCLRHGRRIRFNIFRVFEGHLSLQVVTRRIRWWRTSLPQHLVPAGQSAQTLQARRLRSADLLGWHRRLARLRSHVWLDHLDCLRLETFCSKDNWARLPNAKILARHDRLLRNAHPRLGQRIRSKWTQFLVK